MLVGQVASGFALGEAPTLAKALVDFAKKEDNLTIKGGIMDNRVLSQLEVEALAELPSLDQLRAQIAWSHRWSRSRYCLNAQQWSETGCQRS